MDRMELGESDKVYFLGEDKSFRDACFELTQDNKVFYKILEGISDIVYVLDYDWHFIYLNKEAEKYFFVGRQDVIGKSIWDVFPQAVSTILYDCLHSAKNKKEKMRFEAPSFFELDRWQAYSIYPGEEFLTIIIKDITLRKEQQRHSDELFQRVFNAGVSMISIRTLEGKIIDVNKSWLTSTGYSREEVIGKSEEEINLLNNQETKEKIDRLLELGAIYNLEVDYYTKDKTKRIGLLSIQEIEVGNVKYYLEDITDITKQKEMEQEMAKLDRLNMIGQMAAGISHEFRNPITTVRGFIQMLSGRRELAGIKEYFDIMLEEIDRANSIISEFLTLSKNKVLNLQKRNINVCINRLFPMIQAGAFNDDKYVRLELTEVPDICMDEGEIRQLVLNLVRNALEASPPDGTVTIGTYEENSQVILAIKDEGKGIPADILDKLGTPFFTTKENGTGMGLVVCYRIVERHKANISIDTGPKGTTFYVRFTVPEDDKNHIMRAEQ